MRRRSRPFCISPTDHSGVRRLRGRSINRGVSRRSVHQGCCRPKRREQIAPTRRRSVMGVAVTDHRLCHSRERPERRHDVYPGTARRRDAGIGRAGYGEQQRLLLKLPHEVTEFLLGVLGGPLHWSLSNRSTTPQPCLSPRMGDTTAAEARRVTRDGVFVGRRADPASVASRAPDNWCGLSGVADEDPSTVSAAGRAGTGIW